jgi:glutamyl-tRNA reductase
MELGILGTSVWQQNQPLLERLTLDREARNEQLAQLKAALGISELVYIATCNRVEFVYTTSDVLPGNQILHRLIDFFFRDSREINFFPNDFYHYSGKEAITHIFRTVSSLESIVVGETQITGQFKQAVDDAQEAGLAGMYLEKLANEALNVAKRVKRETGIGNGSLSMASLAFEEMQSSLSDRKGALIALIGAGEMTRKVATYANKAGLGELLFVNRTVEKAESLANEFNGRSCSLEEFIKGNIGVDAIVSATASPAPLFDASFLGSLPERGGPVVCIDLAVPRDFDHDVFASTNAKLIDIPYLKSRAQGSLRKKFVEASKANEIVKQSVLKFLSDRLEVSIKPIFHNSYRESIELAKKSLDDLFSKRVTSLDEKEKEAVLNLVIKLIGHSSFQPARILSDRLAQAQAELDFDKASPETHREAV